MVLICKPWILFTQGCFVPTWSKLAQWFRRRFLNFVSVFLLFRNNLPLDKGGALHLNNLGYPPPMNVLCQVWLKLAQWFWNRIFKKNSSIYFRYFVIISLDKGGVLHLNKLEYPPPMNVLYQVWMKLAHWFWRRRKFAKFTDRWTDRQTDERRMTGDQKSSLDLSAQVSL